MNLKNLEIWTVQSSNQIAFQIWTRHWTETTGLGNFLSCRILTLFVEILEYHVKPSLYAFRMNINMCTSLLCHALQTSWFVKFTRCMCNDILWYKYEYYVVHHVQQIMWEVNNYIIITVSNCLNNVSPLLCIRIIHTYTLYKNIW